jgi:predicted MFS family arabinose efflux permease
MLNPMLVDLGLDLDTVGLTLGVVGSIAALLGAMAGGFLVGRLGRKPSQLVFGVVQALAVLAYLLPARGASDLGSILFAVSVAAFAGGMATTALYTAMMDRCDLQTPATDFTLQQSLASVGPMMGAMTSGFLAAAVGYELHFLICAGLVPFAVSLVALLMTEELAAPGRSSRNAYAPEGAQAG